MPDVKAGLIDPQIIYKKIDLREGMRVAEFGCGRTGFFLFSAAKVVGEKGTVYALDILKDVLENIKNRCRFEGYHNVLTVWTDVEKVGAASVPEKSIDAGFFINVFFQLKNKNNALIEAVRLIKDDGTLVIIDWSAKIGQTLGPEKEAMVDPQTLVDLAASKGFILQENFPINNYQFCLIFKKKKI